MGTTDVQSLTNKTITNSNNSVRASELGTTGASVVISTAAPPSSGQVLKATGATAATWQNGLSDGTSANNVLRWGGTNWVETDTINVVPGSNLLTFKSTANQFNLETASAATPLRYDQGNTPTLNPFEIFTSNTGANGARIEFIHDSASAAINDEVLELRGIGNN